MQHDISDPDISARDLTFIKYCCAELTYSEIAEKMHLSPKTIDGYRGKLVGRYSVKSRVGLVLLAVKKN